MPSVSKHRKLIRNNNLADRISSVQYRITILPAPKLDDPGSAGQTKQRFLSRSIDADKIAGLQDHADAVNIFNVSNGNGLDLHPIAIGTRGGIASSQHRGNLGFAGRCQTKVEPMDPGVQQIPFVTLNLD